MASDPTNPARKLYLVLQRATATSAAQADGAYRSVWSETFNAQDWSTVARKLAKLQALPDQIRQSVVDYVDDPNSILETMDVMEQAFLINPDGKWSTFWQALGEKPLRDLDFAATIVDAHMQLRDRFQIDDAPGLIEYLTQLLDEVQASDLPEEAKQIVVQHLRELIAALSDLDVVTPAEVRSILEKLWTLLRFNPDLFRIFIEHPLAAKVLELICVAATVLSLGGSSPELSQLPAPPQEVVNFFNPTIVINRPAIEPSAPKEITP